MWMISSNTIAGILQALGQAVARDENVDYIARADISDWALILIYNAILALIAIIAADRLRLTIQFWRLMERRPVPKRRFCRHELPSITVQLPVLNERAVIEQLLAAVTSLDYPPHLLEIQLLDDSTDDTTHIAAAAVTIYRDRGHNIQHVRRSLRNGYKAGSLQNGLREAAGDLVVVFDADFCPRSDYLQRVVDYFTDEQIGMVQMRWSYLNANHSLLTRLQEAILDSHFVIEQSARNRSGGYFTFNGSGGIWRREAIEKSGGWQPDTLTEDTDLSVRAQMMGWKFVYLLDTDVPAELPVEMNAFKAQQRRWAKGLIQTAIKLTPRILRHPALRWHRKAELFLRLSGNLGAPLLILTNILQLPVIMACYEQTHRYLLQIGSLLMIFMSLAIMIYCGSAAIYLHAKEKWRLLLAPLVVIAGIGLLLSNTLAVIEALLGINSKFERTPKYGTNNVDDHSPDQIQPYNNKIGLLPFFELSLAIYLGYAVFYALRNEFSLEVVFFPALFMIGYAYAGITPLAQLITGQFVRYLKRLQREFE